MAGSIKIFSRIADVGADRWDALALACRAPVFYHSRFLAAFEQFPLHNVDEFFYLAGSDRNGRLTVALPCYRLTGVDPVRILADHVPEHADRPALLSGVWHSYDTWLLAAHPDTDVVAEVLAEVRSLAGLVGAEVYGFTNVAADNVLARLLDASGVPGIDVDHRFCIELAGYDDVEAFLATLRRKPRQDLKRMVRRAEAAGAQFTTTVARAGDLDGFVDLARAGAHKYGNADYYRRGIYQRFAAALGEQARLVETRYDGRLVGTGLCLLDQDRYHFWTAGSDYQAIAKVSPFYVTFYLTMADAISAHRTVYEMGRRNDVFKLRYGMRRRTLRAYLQLTKRPSTRQHGLAAGRLDTPTPHPVARS